MEKVRFAAPCLLGLEGLVADEFRRMDIKEVEAQNGRVLFSGDFSTMARANLRSRFAERIVIELGNFEARSFDELFEGTKALPWENFIGSVDAFPVKGSSLNSVLRSVPDCQRIIKKAVAQRLGSVYHKGWFEETGSVHQIQFLIMKDKASLMLDTSGVGLHKRGYRNISVLAPIKETLAAAMADIARVRPDSNVYDPCCGSGTILIESAYKALNVAPGFRRHFAAEKWDCVGKDVFENERLLAKDILRKGCGFHGFGGDIDPEAVALSKKNAEKASVASRIMLKDADISKFSPKTDTGIVICNPPYGERLLDLNSAREIYKTMGKVFPRREGFSYYIISPDEEFEEFFGRKADKRRKLYNGMLKCQLYMYFK